MARTALQEGNGNRQQRVQVERAGLGGRPGPAAADQRRRAVLPGLDALAKPARQDAAALDGEGAAVWRLGGGQVEDVLLDRCIVELPRDDTRSACCLGKLRRRGRGADDRQMMVEPGRRCRSGRHGNGRRRPPAARFRRALDLRKRRRRVARQLGPPGRVAPGAGCPPRGSAAPSEVDHAGRTFVHQAGPLHVAAHRAQVAVPGVAHDVLVPNALGSGPETGDRRLVPPA